VAKDVLDAEVFDVCAAVEPAKQVLQAERSLQLQTIDLLALDQRRFRLRRPRLRRKYVDPGVEPDEITSELQRLTGVLWMAARQCEYAGAKILQRYNPLAAFTSEDHAQSPPRLEQATSLIPLPQLLYRSTKQQVDDLCPRIGRMAVSLNRLCARGIERIEGASFRDGLAYDPHVVWSEAATLSSVTIAALATCAALAQLASQPIVSSNGKR
jgi:hypothetical protein